MTTYTKETALYNTNAIETDIEDAGNAYKTYITEVTSDGIMVAAAGKGTSNGSIVSTTTGWHLSDVLEWVRNGVSRFWIGLKNQGDTTPTVRIGKAYVSGASDNESHMELDYHSMQLVDMDGVTYFHVSDVRDRDGKVTETFAGDGTKTTFPLSFQAKNANYNVYVNGTEVTTGVTKTIVYFSFSTAPASSATITAHYTALGDAKAYTFGKRKSNSRLGGMSVAEGQNCEASGFYAHAEGNTTTASGPGAHSEGTSSRASGICSHAEGSGTEASGLNSHAQNVGTVAASENQTSLGKWNVPDANNTYAIIFGNGTADNARSNALAVDWDGNVDMAGDVRDTNGGLRYAPIAYGMLSGISDTTALTTSAQKAPMDAFTGSGCSKYSNGIKVDEAGVYLISAQMYYSTGFTAGDLIHTMISKNGNTALSETVARATATSPYTVYQTGPVIASLDAGDAVYVYVYNQTGARGYITSYGNGRGNTLTVVRIA